MQKGLLLLSLCAFSLIFSVSESAATQLQSGKSELFSHQANFNRIDRIASNISETQSHPYLARRRRRKKKENCTLTVPAEHFEKLEIGERVTVRPKVTNTCANRPYELRFSVDPSRGSFQVAGGRATYTASGGRGTFASLYRACYSNGSGCSDSNKEGFLVFIVDPEPASAEPADREPENEESENEREVGDNEDEVSNNESIEPPLFEWYSHKLSSDIAFDFYEKNLQWNTPCDPKIERKEWKDCLGADSRFYVPGTNYFWRKTPFHQSPVLSPQNAQLISTRTDSDGNERTLLLAGARNNPSCVKRGLYTAIGKTYTIDFDVKVPDDRNWLEQANWSVLMELWGPSDGWGANPPIAILTRGRNGNPAFQVHVRGDNRLRPSSHPISSDYQFEDTDHYFPIDLSDLNKTYHWTITVKPDPGGTGYFKAVLTSGKHEMGSFELKNKKIGYRSRLGTGPTLPLFGLYTYSIRSGDEVSAAYDNIRIACE